jgi:hypothetical protein
MARAAILQRKAAARSAPLQAKLNVGPVGDRFEQEADRVASRIGSSSTTAASPPTTISGLSVQRVAAPPASGPEKQDEDVAPPEKRAQRKAKTAPKKEDKKSAPRAQRKAAAAPKKEDKKSAPRAQRKAAPKAAPKNDEKPTRRAQRKAAASPKKEEKKSPSRAQRKAAAPSKKTDDKKPQKKSVAQGERTTAQVGAQGGAVPADVDTAIQRMRKRPAPRLDPTTRARVENAVGSDLGGVRVHTDAAAADAANALGARAFTVGQDMFFGQGQYGTQSTEGQRLIAHEAAHTVQQRGGSAGAQRVQRNGKKGTAKGNSKTTPPKKSDKDPAKNEPVDRIEGKKWAVDFNDVDSFKGTVEIAKLELPSVAKALKGTDAAVATADKGRSLPVKGESFTLNPVPTRAPGKAFETWNAGAQPKVSKLASQLQTQIEGQKKPKAAALERGRKSVYVLYGGGKSAGKARTMFIGTPKELTQHDSLVRPMIGPEGGSAILAADHCLELQIGGMDSYKNMMLLDAKFNREVGPTIAGKIKTSITDALKGAHEKLDETGAKPAKKLPETHLDVLRNWVVVFGKVTEMDFRGTKTYWTREDIEAGNHFKYFKAMSEKELIAEGFKFQEGVIPKEINVFPSRTGGYAVAFPVSKDGKKIEPPDFFYRGFEVQKGAALKLPTDATKNQVLASIPVRRTRKKKGTEIVEFADAKLDIRHDENLGFGGYITDESRTGAFQKGKVKFKPLCPIVFSDVQITPEGELFAIGTIMSEVALLPGLQVPIILRGEDILLQFPIPTESLNFGPVHVTDAALEMGVGANGFFIAGVAGIAIDNVGSGSLTARAEKDDVILKGDFNFDLTFLKPAKVEASYSLMKDDFYAKATLGVEKGALPGVDSGTVEVAVTRATFGLVGSLNLGGILSGSTITVGYTPETGLLIEGKDLPLPVEKLPGVSDAKVTVRAQRSPDTGEWSVSGGGKAGLSAGGAHGTLDIMFDGIAVTFTGRVDVAKGPATGWLQITGTNRAIDDEGKPIENGPVGDLHIWGKGEATIAFGKILTGKAGIEYTPDGSVIISGEIALPPTYDLFPKKDLSPKEPLFEVKTPDFPIWGVKVGPVGFGIFAFADASIKLEAYVGPGQLRDTKVQATIDLDKPEEATVHGQAQFYVPAYAGLRLDVGGGVKAQAAVAYVKGRVGLYGTLGLLVEGSFDVGVDWNPTDGFAVGAEAKIVASPKFELGVTASITAGVDLGLFDIDKTWGPWEKELGSFGPNMQLGASFPMKWSEKEGLDFDTDDIKIQKPTIDAKEIMKGAFDMLV